MVKVLIVDDSQTLRQMVNELLTKQAIKVIEAASGLEGLEKVQEDAPDLVIVDLVMPQMNGYELCRFLKNNPTTQQIPVLICSTKSQDFDRYWGMKQGADAYLTKPFQPAELLRTIKVLLENLSGAEKSWNPYGSRIFINPRFLRMEAILTRIGDFRTIIEG